jgi:hypothetical protein
MRDAYRLRTYHDAVFGVPPQRQSPSMQRANQVAVQDLNGRQRSIFEAKKETKTRPTVLGHC